MSEHAKRMATMGNLSDLPGSYSDWQWVVYRGMVIFIHHRHRPRVLEDGELEILNPLPLSEAVWDS